MGGSRQGEETHGSTDFCLAEVLINRQVGMMQQEDELCKCRSGAWEYNKPGITMKKAAFQKTITIQVNCRRYEISSSNSSLFARQGQKTQND
ncbi:hypothetical protein SAY86_020603 [Trapa natans]|uniref:Uncharacterized protein n=1 Tax=Trapa natans TaxID=22666 RepID=A0AAN7LQS2_TRANT|nr:hypothetical protein SAY86_020603 [Trapa natans]